MTLEHALIHSPAESDEYFMEEGCFILEGWNRPEDPALSIARARVEPGERTRLHRLDGVVERYLILVGVGLLEVEGLEPRRVGPGDLVYIPAGAAQRIENDGDCDLIFLAICTPRFTPEVYQDIEPD
ncbi:cupin domain-containing protein [Allochromatium vinosum]|uniref:Cupin 2 conserved barrel domain protein n=1 Tax=Allochromatium vinosum (strain ATCC 17899 / DSM 180 / NBRC 103801 / NCIMB 10441 / D) TaxID=572477 RepID=D3RV08_ALLVD|nr:cupin domain-containing protein [Allochromatium vinosum]ADC62940.1 Cupin 2 conserved barrel domain protein [Allochromatium vinosum DSM 180]